MDFSVYGPPSAEWEEYARENPVPPSGLAAGQTVDDLRARTNHSRELAAAEFMKESGLQTDAFH